MTFESSELLWKRLTPKRWELLRTLQGAREMSVREAARRANLQELLLSLNICFKPVSFENSQRRG
ncbi:MAG: HVO_A0114 family putative DNA-binding protein [Sulfuricaulis sp.]